jgi:hypothetical protein
MRIFKGRPSEVMNKGNGNNVLVPRKLMPELHDKTHFKAAYAIMLNN